PPGPSRCSQAPGRLRLLRLPTASQRKRPVKACRRSGLRAGRKTLHAPDGLQRALRCRAGAAACRGVRPRTPGFARSPHRSHAAPTCPGSNPHPTPLKATQTGPRPGPAARQPFPFQSNLQLRKLRILGLAGEQLQSPPAGRFAMHGLNPQQAAAVTHCDGPLLVLAGAGSGKTRVIVEKIAHLVSSGRYPARRIAAITFTNKSAKEMRERVARRIRGDGAEGLTVCTFHALGLKMLQIDHAKVGLRRGFSVFDSDDCTAQFRDLMPGAKPDAVQAMAQLVSRAKNGGLSPEEAAAAARSTREAEAASLFARYQARLETFNAVDFDDLIRLPVQLLESDEDARLGWRERIGYLLVDACQDTNDAQYRLLKALAGPAGNFTCVGDDDQSIYAWRGANPENLSQLGRDYPALRVVKLEQNYRCSNRVLRAANALIANNPHEHPKTLWSAQPDGERIRVWECRDAAHEAERVAAEIDFLHAAKQIPWSEFCVLFRGNHQSRALEKAMQLLRIPYHLSGGTAFLDRGEVKDALSWLRLVANPEDDAAFLRAVQSPSRGIGATSLAKLAEMARHAHLPLSRAAESMG